MAPRAPRPIPTRPLSRAWFPGDFPDCMGTRMRKGKHYLYNVMYPKESNKLRTCEETGVDIGRWILILLRRRSSKVGLTRAQTDQTDEKEEESSHCCKWVSRMVFMRTRNFHLPVDKFLHVNKT